MPETRQGKNPHRRPHPQPMAASFLEFDLERELAGLRSEGPPASGQNAKTLVKHDDFRIILMALEAKARMEKHQNAGRISIHTLRGRIRVRAMERTFDLRAGSILALDRRLPHDVEALEDSAVLLTIAWPGRTAARPRFRSSSTPRPDTCDGRTKKGRAAFALRVTAGKKLRA